MKGLSKGAAVQAVSDPATPEPAAAMASLTRSTRCYPKAAEKPANEERLSKKAWKNLSDESKGEILRRRAGENRERSPRRSLAVKKAAAEKARTVEQKPAEQQAAVQRQQLLQPKWKAPPPEAPAQIAPQPVEQTQLAQPAEQTQLAQSTPNVVEWVVVAVPDETAPAGARAEWLHVNDLDGRTAWASSEAAQRALQQRAVGRALARLGGVILE